MMSQSAENTQPKARVHMETWGCQMNVADSEKMLSLLDPQHYTLTESPENADLIILNTCHIREKAKHKVVSRLGVLKDLKKQNKDLVIAVTGCVAQAEGKKLLDQAPTIDVLLGPGKIPELPKLLAEQKNRKEQVMALGFNRHAEPKEAEDPIIQSSLFGRNDISRYVNIQQGCNNFCTFCVVPFTRGRETSVPHMQIVEQAKTFVAAGAKEITLLGQNVNSYGLDLVKTVGDESPFVKLLRDVASIEGLLSLRFTTSNPHDLDKPLADLFYHQPKLGRYFHLPVQSGSDRILAAMRRKVNVKEYLEKISWLRAAVPDMAISTDLIVGFPSETEEEFEQSLELLAKVRYSFVFAFAYSPRKGTAAQRFLQQIDEDTKKRRLAKVNELQDKITLEHQQAQLGKELDVLFLYESKKEPGIYYGRCPYFRLVRVASGRDITGQRLVVKVNDFNKTALSAELI